MDGCEGWDLKKVLGRTSAGSLKGLGLTRVAEQKGNVSMGLCSGDK